MVNERETGKSAGVLLAALSVYVSRAKDFTARTYAFPGSGCAALVCGCIAL